MVAQNQQHQGLRLWRLRGAEIQRRNRRQDEQINYFRAQLPQRIKGAVDCLGGFSGVEKGADEGFCDAGLQAGVGG